MSTYNEVPKILNITGSGAADNVGGGLLHAIYNSNSSGTATVIIDETYRMYMPIGGYIPINPAVPFTGIRIFSAAQVPNVNVLYSR